MAIHMVIRNKNQGMAMLMALVMLAIASSLAAYIWYDSQLSLARIHNLKQAYQAKHYSQGMMLWASDILREDYAQDETQHDSLSDPWLQGIQGMVVEDAILSGSLNGMNSRFNVNNLVVNGEVSELHLTYLRRLLSTLELDLGIAEKMIDWIDADQIPMADGAEDFIYLAKSPSYQTGSKYFQHVGELALLDGLSPSDYRRLLPYVTTLPIRGNQPTKMNVNTISPPLIKSLSLNINNEMAVRLNQNNQANFTSMNDFFQHNSIRYVVTNTEERNNIEMLAGVQTLDLQASSTIQMEGQVHQMYALMRRQNNGSARVLVRSMAPFIPTDLL
ncbi:type II secretion system minor pseudopilin GspK [Marinicella litoralis]|uniref:Type II secretion system protein K n=1 Tax=Marinicella litoralis TaxID=644220 RepID=A0A4R6XJ38_9GAMM|nr:type II secretion system minor pseudopilin GspK [Marinicella litoralis]TDR19516.1 general secretion pathway protein K [Marinicella litoralis]